MLKGTLQGVRKIENILDKIRELAATDKSCDATLAEYSVFLSSPPFLLPLSNCKESSVVPAKPKMAKP